MLISDDEKIIIWRKRLSESYDANLRAVETQLADTQLLALAKLFTERPRNT